MRYSIVLILLASLSIGTLQAQGDLSMLADSVLHYRKSDEGKAHDFALEAMKVAARSDDSCQYWRYQAVAADYSYKYGVDSSVYLLERSLAGVDHLSCEADIRQLILRMLAWNHRLAGNYQASLDLCRVLLDEFADDPEGRFRALNTMGATYSYLGMVDSAVIAFLDAYEIVDGLGDENRSTMLNNICTVYNDNGLPAKAKEYCEKARRVARQDDYDYAYGLATNTLGCIYNDLGKRDSARLLVQEALSVDLPELARHYSYLELGRIEEYDANYEQSRDYYLQALTYVVDPGYAYEEAYNRSNLANIYSRIGQHDKALDQSTQALKIYEQLDGVPQELVDVYERHMVALAGAGVPLSLDHLETYFVLTDSIHSAEKRSQLVDIEEKYQNDNLRQQQEQQQATITSQRLLIGLGCTALGILSLLLHMLYRQRERQKSLIRETQRQRDEISVLNQEINHRVKNNLAFITSLLGMQARRVDLPQAKEAIQQSESRLQALSLVHQVLGPQSDTTSVDLKDYLSLLIQRLVSAYQLPGRTADIQHDLVSYEMDAESAMRVGLIVNELVTNSVKHVRGSHLIITLSSRRRDDDRLYLVYTDSGNSGSRAAHNTEDISSSSLGLQLVALLRQQLQDDLVLTVA